MPAQMKALTPKTQTVRVGGQTRHLYLEQETADPDVAQVSLGMAISTLSEAFTDIQKLAREAEKPKKLVKSARCPHVSGLVPGSRRDPRHRR
jgi:hypothetical protein